MPQSVAPLICVPQVSQTYHKMWHNSIYLLNTNHFKSQNNNYFKSSKVSTFHQKSLSMKLQIMLCLGEGHKDPICMCHKVWHIWYVCHKCPKCGTKFGKIVFILFLFRGIGVKFYTIFLIFKYPSKAWVLRFPEIDKTLGVNFISRVIQAQLGY